MTHAQIEIHAFGSRWRMCQRIDPFRDDHTPHLCPQVQCRSALREAAQQREHLSLEERHKLALPLQKHGHIVVECIVLNDPHPRDHLNERRLHHIDCIAAANVHLRRHRERD